MGGTKNDYVFYAIKRGMVKGKVNNWGKMYHKFMIAETKFKIICIHIKSILKLG